ncbi:MAG TPA: gephyrin-like molybdotransferase Glp, partial [Actinopolymorphaceae bacterium]
RAADLPDGKAVLPVIEEVTAGQVPRLPLGPGQATRIMTGAPIPHGADAIVPVEWTDGGVAKVTIRKAPDAGAFIRRQGEDVRAGEVLLRAGTMLGARELALLAASGHGAVVVRPRPRVVVLSTGSELREPGEPLGEGLVPDANGYALAAAVRQAGGIPFRVGIVPDDGRQFSSMLEDQLVRADLIVTSGGVSAGAFDIVKQVLGRLGTVRFTGVAMQPGMPQGFGVIGEDEIPIFTLPGNPVSAYVSFQVFVKPALRAMLGARPIVPPTVPGTVTEGWRSSAGKRQFARVRYALGRITPVSGAGSHLVAGLARANALAVVPEDVTQVQAGDRLDVMVLDE